VLAENPYRIHKIHTAPSLGTTQQRIDTINTNIQLQVNMPESIDPMTTPIFVKNL